MKIEVYGIDVHASEKGVFLFLHGAGMNSEVWRRQQSSLNGIALDLPGHGKSDEMDVNSIKDYAKFLVEFIDVLELEPIVVGHSMGGAVVQEYLTLGGVAIGAVLVSTAPSFRVNLKIIEEIDRDFQGTVERFVGWMFSKNFTGRKVVEDVRAIIRGEGKETFKRDLLICNSFAIEDRYKNRKIEFDCPVMIVCGNEDAVIPPIHSEFLREHIDGSRLVFIHGCGHLPMIETPKEFSKILREFQDGLRV